MYRFFDHFGDERLSSNDLLVLIAVCCNQDYCSKSAITLAEETRLSRRTVHSCLDNLEKNRLIIVQKITHKTWKIWPQIKKYSK